MMSSFTGALPVSEAVYGSWVEYLQVFVERQSLLGGYGIGSFKSVSEPVWVSAYRVSGAGSVLRGSVFAVPGVLRSVAAYLRGVFLLSGRFGVFVCVGLAAIIGFKDLIRSLISAVVAEAVFLKYAVLVMVRKDFDAVLVFVPVWFVYMFHSIVDKTVYAASMLMYKLKQVTEAIVAAYTDKKILAVYKNVGEYVRLIPARIVSVSTSMMDRAAYVFHTVVGRLIAECLYEYVYAGIGVARSVGEKMLCRIATVTAFARSLFLHRIYTAYTGVKAVVVSSASKIFVTVLGYVVVIRRHAVMIAYDACLCMVKLLRAVMVVLREMSMHIYRVFAGLVYVFVDAVNLRVARTAYARVFLAARAAVDMFCIYAKPVIVAVFFAVRKLYVMYGGRLSYAWYGIREKIAGFKQLVRKVFLKEKQ